MIKDKNLYNILVIEDNPGDLILVEEYLFEQIVKPGITYALTYSEAAVCLRNPVEKFDVILLDLTLPDKSGQQLITEILSLSGESPVVVLTGHANIDFSIQSISLGISDYLLKDDLNASSLYKSIVYCIERKKRMDELTASEKRYGDLFHQSPQPMWVFDPVTLYFIQVNKAAIQHYGYTEGEFLKMRILDIRPTEDALALVATRKTLKPAEENFHGRFRHQKKNGELITVEIYANSITIQQRQYRLAIAVDITEKLQVDHKITNAILKTQEDERYEIGAELHDNVCQILAASQMTLGMLKNGLTPDVQKWYDQSAQYITLATEEIRNLSHRLAPAFYNETTLEDAFLILLNSFNLEGRYKTELFFDERAKNALINRDLQLNLYRILQEQLRNILKYAKGQSIEVDVMLKNENLVMRVADDGIGFDNTLVKGGIGICNMKRRAELFSGNFQLYSAPGKGCEIMVEIPMPAVN